MMRKSGHYKNVKLSMMQSKWKRKKKIPASLCLNPESPNETEWWKNQNKKGMHFRTTHVECVVSGSNLAGF